MMGKFRTYSAKKKNRGGFILKVGYRNLFTLTGQGQHVVLQYSHSSLGQLLNLKKNPNNTKHK